MNATSVTTPTLSIAYPSTSKGTPPTKVALLSRTSASTYDLAGDVTTTTDALNNTTTYGYDSLGRQISDKIPT